MSFQLGLLMDPTDIESKQRTVAQGRQVILTISVSIISSRKVYRELQEMIFLTESFSHAKLYRKFQISIFLVKSSP